LIAYLDASVVVPLIKIEDSSEELRSYLDDLRDEGHLLVSCRLLETELRRAAIRQRIPQETVTAILDTINVFELVAADCAAAIRVSSVPAGGASGL